MMENTCCINLPVVNLPIGFSKTQARIASTAVDVIGSSSTIDAGAAVPQIVVHQEREYTDAQFHADLKKASKRLKAMAAEASREHAEGKTERFPA